MNTTKSLVLLWPFVMRDATMMEPTRRPDVTISVCTRLRTFRATIRVISFYAV